MTKAKQTAIEILEREHIGVMVTNQDGRPVAKYMTFQNDGYDLYTLIPQETVAKMNINNYTHILLGYEGDDIFETFIEYEGQYNESENAEIAQKLQDIYPITETGHFTLLRISANRIRIMNKAGHNQEEIIFNDTL